jgi:hypothetical protein
MQAKFPTGTLAAIGLEVGHWREIAPGIGHLEAFVRPKDLA